MSENKRKQITDNFYEDEFTCKCGCGLNNINPLHVHRLQIARKIYGRKIIITSGTRCKIWNEKQGGKENSAHLTGLATDLLCKRSRDRYFLNRALYKAGFKRIGVSGSFIHVDSDLGKPQNVQFLYLNQPDSSQRENGKT